MRLKWANGRPVEEGIYNPAEQNEKHMAVLSDVFRDPDVAPLPPLVSVVVLPRPEVVVEGYRPELGYRLVRVDGLRAFIEERGRLPAAACGPAGDLVGKLLKYHVPAGLDVCARYGIDPKETLPLKDRVQFDPDLRGYRCAFCGSKIALLKNRMGLAWGCSSYPQCRNLVPASVVVQVGQEAAEELKGKRLLAGLLGPKLKVCPSCGSVLMWQDARGGAWYCLNSRLCGYRPR
ncbi:MAG: hypothetical protein AB1816_15350 [Bacillota bacterium]